MKYKHIEAARETRLWIGQILVPTTLVVGYIMSNPELRQKAANTVYNIKRKIRIKRESK